MPNKTGVYVLNSDEFTFFGSGVHKIIDQLPRDLVHLLETLELLRTKPELDDILTTDPIYVRAKLDTANLPWTHRQTQQGTITDRDDTVIIVGKPEALQGIIYVLKAIHKILSVIERYREPNADCLCGHERISHLFVAMTSACVERPCRCQKYILA
jgi:hypothetical protein